MAIKLITDLPGPKSQELMKRRQSAVARGPFHATPLFVESAKGCVLRDVDGNELLDFASGIGVNNVGHGQALVIEAIKAQADNFLHASFNVNPYEGYVALAEKLNDLCPGENVKKSFLVSTGAEAVENAVKISRVYTGRKTIVAFEHAFHGRTYMAMSLTYKYKPYKSGFEPFNDGVLVAPMPYEYRWTHDDGRAADSANFSTEEFENESWNRFVSFVAKNGGPDTVAGVIFEPVLGEGGFIPFSKSFMLKLRDYCTTNGIVMIADEIQSGFGRTGRLFAMEHFGVAADLVTSAKGLGGGLPISAVTGRAEIMDAPAVGGIGGTYGGNPLACASALAVIELMQQGDILRNAQAMGETLAGKLSEWKERFSCVGDVRGLGPMRAIELVKSRSTREPAADLTRNLLSFCHARGLVLMNAGNWSNVVRFLPPLVTKPAELAEGLAIVEAGLVELTK